MKKLALAAAVASMLATPALAAAPRHDYHRAAPHQTVKRTVVVHRAAPVHRNVVRRASYRTTYRAPTYQYRDWQRGQRFDSRYAPNYREIDYRGYRGLRTPPSGYHWVQSGNDAVLVSIASGLIGAVIGGVLLN